MNERLALNSSSFRVPPSSFVLLLCLSLWCNLQGVNFCNQALLEGGFGVVD
jgi:hypothetical protein